MSCRFVEAHLGTLGAVSSSENERSGGINSLERAFRTLVVQNEPELSSFVHTTGKDE